MDKTTQKDTPSNNSESKESAQPLDNPLSTVKKPTTVNVYNTDSAYKLKEISNNG